MRPFTLLSPSCAAPLMLIAVFCLGCDGSGAELPTQEFPPDPDLPEAVVDLPNPPPASAFEIREFNDDDSLRVEGVIAKREQYFGDNIEIRGVISKIEGSDCDPATEPCPKPHFFIRDHIDEDLDLMVMGYRNEFLDRASLSEGEEYLFRGTFDQMAGDFVSTQGLLELEIVDEFSVIEKD